MEIFYQSCIVSTERLVYSLQRIQDKILPDTESPRTKSVLAESLKMLQGKNCKISGRNPADVNK